MEDVTQILNACDPEDPTSAERLIQAFYEELRKLAAAKLAREAAGQTLQATALVHEAWLRINNDRDEWKNRKQFFSAAAEAMRRILIDKARRRMRVRHGGDLEAIQLETWNLVPDPNSQHSEDDRLLALDEALKKLEKNDSSAAELVRLRFFIGLKHSEAAETLGISERTAKRTWAFDKAWLAEEISLSKNSAFQHFCSIVRSQSFL